jgi:uncharacterized damage-inducible protein DinB
MITDMSAYLRFFDGVRRRTERDIATLPAGAAAWRPPATDGEHGWSIGRIVGHIGGSRLYFASAYRGEGWLAPTLELDENAQDTWLPWLRSSADRFAALLADTPADWLTRRVETIDTPGATLSGWRLLMMNVEHEVHHRSQVDAYAGLQGWPVPDIFNRAWETIAELAPEQRAKYRR